MRYSHFFTSRVSSYIFLALFSSIIILFAFHQSLFLVSPPPKTPAYTVVSSCWMDNQNVPKPGEWPVDPQNDVKISAHRIWVDGCFDFAHHGLQARCPSSWRTPKAY